MHGHGHGIVKQLMLVFLLAVGVLWTVSHPVKAVTIVAKVVTALAQVADNFATGRYR